MSKNWKQLTEEQLKRLATSSEALVVEQRKSVSTLRKLAFGSLDELLARKEAGALTVSDPWMRKQWNLLRGDLRAIYNVTNLLPLEILKGLDEGQFDSSKWQQYKHLWPATLGLSAEARAKLNLSQFQNTPSEAKESTEVKELRKNKPSTTV